MPGAPAPESELAGAIDGLSGVQQAQHLQGDAEFARLFTPATGLGPVFTAQSCEACHVGDGKGHPRFTITRFAPGAISVRLTPPAVTGLGLLEAVPDSVLLALDDSLDTKSADGISGRVQRVDGGRIGRFGKKARAASLLEQVVTAYHEDMGITSDWLPQEFSLPGVEPLLTDVAPEPEVSAAVVHAVTFYIKTLKQPPRRRASNSDVAAGDALFAAGPCASCHLPTLMTGDSPIAALHRVTFHPYTDLLLHDMGPGLDDGFTEGHALTSEWRTPPLWGLGLAAQSQGGRMFLMHDGRAGSIEEAIALHGGEATAARDWFLGLSGAQRTQLLAFLKSL